MVALPRTCKRCGNLVHHYGSCTETPECREAAIKNRNMRALLDLAREIDPSLPPDRELENRIVTITLSKDGPTVSLNQ